MCDFENYCGVWVCPQGIGRRWRKLSRRMAWPNWLLRELLCCLVNIRQKEGKGGSQVTGRNLAERRRGLRPGK